jgi:hypothetical protein
MAFFMIWVSAHRVLFLAFGAFLLWIAAYLYYLKNDIRAYFRNRAPHVWGVDMEKKKVTQGRAALQ